MQFENYIQQATIHLAFNSNETSKYKLSIILIWLSVIFNKVHAKIHKKLVHFYMLITLKHLKVVEKVVKEEYGAKI